MSKAEQLELINLTTNFLRTTKPQSCKNYRILSQEPLFRGICYGASQFNLSPEEIEQEVSKLLKFDAQPSSKYSRVENMQFDDKRQNIENSRIDEILPYILKFKPEEINRLPIDLQKRIINQWIVYQKGFTKARQIEFDKAYGKAMSIVNNKVLKSVSEAISKNHSNLSSKTNLSSSPVKKNEVHKEENEVASAGKRKKGIPKQNKTEIIDFDESEEDESEKKE
ncbi:hypothetical protein TRFO_14173 [Tritrichomonas foetus]|uniref:Uncharacterized protein n=1 Tax=Tritrichomonas foetus TaxID=1144522 RepID=A0A1J4L0L6_9EUKA|nr:hypothetical protein TRFO_14173 [Tritrichomonas foetus]|eukprot:OHT15405.1 hypothetical protein TRFO_14173 [Tritrichomonas foetus]